MIVGPLVGHNAAPHTPISPAVRIRAVMARGLTCRRVAAVAASPDRSPQAPTAGRLAIISWQLQYDTDSSTGAVRSN